ncbi:MULTISPECIES: hypothetical protein [Dietzia]|uniref:hypothetical protein n=1 Tax=Dietzia TaxID=37914 RepID=UPI000E7374AB|nr:MULTISPECIES: hypothetical protein [Dietzia]RKE55098.1 hypothetical protein BXY47_3189 [Dietzia kunjamensis]USX45430.1 hypothetical protein NHB83_14560 [Dietzia kunjamensis]
MTDPDPTDPDPTDPTPPAPPPTVGGPTDGDLTGGSPVLYTTAHLCKEHDRGMDYTLDVVEYLTVDLATWLTDIAPDGSGRGQEASERARHLGRMVDQLCTMSTLVELSLRQRRELGDPTTAWVLLEQARQQLGWAASTAGALARSIARAEGDVARGPADADAGLPDDALPDDETTMIDDVLEFFLERDLAPRPDHAREVVDMGDGVGVIPDPRPLTPLELVPLQLLSATAMQCGSVIDDPAPRTLVDRMAYGTYVARLLDEASELLREYGPAAGQRELERLADTAQEAADIMWQLTPGPLEVFAPRSDGPAAA